LLTSVKTFSSLQEAVPHALDDQVKALSAVYGNASIEDDFREFIEANKTPSEPSEPFEFVPFKSKYEEEEQVKAKEADTKPETQRSTETVSTFSTQTAEEKLEKKG